MSDTQDTPSTAVRPEDLLPAGAESGVINGVEVRKGSVAAILANAKLLDTVAPGSAEEADIEEEGARTGTEGRVDKANGAHRSILY